MVEKVENMQYLFMGGERAINWSEKGIPMGRDIYLWEVKVILPEEQGGLGIRDLSKHNNNL